MNRKLRFAVAIMVMAVFVGGTTGIYVLGETSLDDQIESFGYEPLLTPSTLWRPGSFYHVRSNGRLNPVCHPAPEDLEPYVHESPTQTVQASSHFSSDARIGAKLLETLTVLIGADSLKEVRVSLSSVSVQEIDYRNLHKIAKAMLSDADCNDVATRLVREGELVCQVASALQATASYQVLYESGMESNAEVREQGLRRIEDMLSASFAGETGSNGSMLKTGTSLFYGIVLHPQCLTLPDDEAPRRLQVSWADSLRQLVADLL